MIEEIRITDTESLIRRLNELPNNFIFRGLADSSWQLTSTLQRTLGEKWDRENAAKFENYSLDAFKSKYHIYKSGEHDPASKLSWLSLMQHYGVPTRLIDFSESPYVSLYFALEAYNPASKVDLAIYALDYSAIMDVSLSHIANKDSSFQKNRFEVASEKDKVFDEIVDRFSYEMLWVTEPLQMNARIDRQAGTFVLSCDAGKSIEQLLESNDYQHCVAKKFSIDGELYESIFALLRKMNISAKTIYGDLSGLANSIRMELQVYAI